MSKRLQIVMSDDEIEAFRRTAKRQGMTLSEWVRQAMRKVQRSQQSPSAPDKLKAIERALECDYPTGNIEEILSSIEQGRDLR
jgi:hypothetical protein